MLLFVFRIRQPPISTRTDPLSPDTTRFRSQEAPVAPFHRQEDGGAHRHPAQHMVVGGTRLDQADPCGAVIAEPARQHAAGRAAANDNIIVLHGALPVFDTSLDAPPAGGRPAFAQTRRPASAIPHIPTAATIITRTTPTPPMEPH